MGVPWGGGWGDLALEDVELVVEQETAWLQAGAGPSLQHSLVCKGRGTPGASEENSLSLSLCAPTPPSQKGRRHHGRV